MGPLFRGSLACCADFNIQSDAVSNVHLLGFQQHHHQSGVVKTAWAIQFMVEPSVSPVVPPFTVASSSAVASSATTTSFVVKANLFKER